MTRTLLTAAVASAVTIAALTGCTANAHPSTTQAHAQPAVPQPLPSAPTPPAAPPAAPAAVTTPPVPATARTVAARPCTPDALPSLAELPGGGALTGTVIVTIRVVNTSGQHCTLRGYPTFTLTTHSASMGRDIPEPVTLEHGHLDVDTFRHAPATVDLAPGDHAGFQLAFTDIPPSGAHGCDTATRIYLTLPGASRPVDGPVQITMCNRTLPVSPYLPYTRLPVY